jgi:hypothetical protein
VVGVADLRRVARQRAKRYGLNPTLFERQISQESGFNPHAVSPAGARGVAQIMPGTAAAWHVNPDKPVQALDAAARNMASYVKQFGSFRNALVAYNAGPGAVGHSLPAETRNYIAKITGGGAGQKGLGGTGGGSFTPFNPFKVKLGQKSSFDRAGFEQARKNFILGQFLTSQHGPQGTVMQRVGLIDQATAPSKGDYTTSRLTSKIVGGTGGDFVAGGGDLLAGGGKRGRVNIAAGANRAGVGVQGIVKQFLSGAAGIAGEPITVTTGTNHNRMTVNGNVSDHWDGRAGDIAVAVDSAQGDRIAAAALIEAGVPKKKAVQMARQGGLFNVNKGGHRVQVIWKTNEGGNHHNHVHVGIR